MTPTRQAALNAAIAVWAVEVEDDAIEHARLLDRILLLADAFEVWLDRPSVARLILTPGDIRRTSP